MNKIFPGLEIGQLTIGQLNDIIKKLGGYEGALRFLRDEIVVSESTNSWCEKDDIIYSTVISDGATGDYWIKRLKSNGVRFGDYTEYMLRSSDFKPTNGVTTKVAILKGKLFEDNDRIPKKIRVEAIDRRNLFKLSVELACLIREKFTDKEIEAMGLQHIYFMHEPINYLGGTPLLLFASRSGGGRWLSACQDKPGVMWGPNCGFAFAVK
jgi:hypothetical protein